jgi:hypothetical protein
MVVVVTCVLLVLAGIVAVARWGDLPVQPPPTGEADAATRPPPGLVVRRYLWHVTVALTTGVGAGILAAGAGGRLVMRLLAVTAGPEAQGQVTEANEVVGRISVDGTIGFLLFAGLAGRYSRALPLLSAEPRTVAAYAPLLLLVPLFVAIPVIVALGLVALLAAQVRPLLAAWRDRRAVAAGRAVLAAVALVALPGFVADLATILRPT